MRLLSLILVIWTAPGMAEAARASPEPASGLATGLASLDPVRAPQDPKAFVEVAAPKQTWFVHEPVEIVLRVGIDAAWFRANAIQTSRVQLDLPVEVTAQHLRELAGTVAVEDEARRDPSVRRMTLAVNGEKTEAVVAADRAVGGRPFAVVEVTRRVTAVAPGPLVVPAPTLRFAYATRFEEDLVNGRVPVDRKDASVLGQELALAIRALPDAGRPAGFGGAVGQFSIAASVDRAEVSAGESFRLTLAIEGPGNLRSFDPPRLDAIPKLHVYGAIDSTTGPRRTILYDVAADDDGLRAIPAIPFPFFDPTPPGQYRTAFSAAIAMKVKAAPASAPVRTAVTTVAPALVPGTSDIFGLRASPSSRGDHAFATGRYEEALALFQSALARAGGGEGVLLFDLGGASWRLGRHAEALWFWRRAALLLPRDAELAFNVQFAERQLEVDPPKLGPLPGALAVFTRTELIVATALIAATALFATVALRRRRAAVVLCALAAVFGLALLAHAVGWPPSAPRGVVLAREIALRAEPHREAAVSVKLRAGESVLVEESSDRWARVVHPRGSGWTEREGLGVVE